MLGNVLFYDMNGMFFGVVQVGVLFDMIKFMFDGSKLLVVNEGEFNDVYDNDLEGSVLIIDLSGGVGVVIVIIVDFMVFNGMEVVIEVDGGCIFGFGVIVVQDLELEYIIVIDDGVIVYVICQENNVIVVVDVVIVIVIDLFGFGLKVYCELGNDFDLSNEDGGINIVNWFFYGYYQLDGIECYFVGGNMYIVFVNEGDVCDYDVFFEEDCGDDLDLDEVVYLDVDELQMDENLGCICIFNVEGDVDNDGDVDQIIGYGGCLFSIWDVVIGDLVFDFGSDLGNIFVVIIFSFFNVNDGDVGEFDECFDDKGIELEGVVIKEIGGNVYVFIIFECVVGGFVVYNIIDFVVFYFVMYIFGVIVGDIVLELFVVIVLEDNLMDGFLVLLVSEELNILVVYIVVDNKEFGVILIIVVVNGGFGVYIVYVWVIIGGIVVGEVSLIDEDMENFILNIVLVIIFGIVELEVIVIDENGCVIVVIDVVYVVLFLEIELVIEDFCFCLDNVLVIDLNNNIGGEDGQFVE